MTGSLLSVFLVMMGTVNQMNRLVLTSSVEENASAAKMIFARFAMLTELNLSV